MERSEKVTPECKDVGPPDKTYSWTKPKGFPLEPRKGVACVIRISDTRESTFCHLVLSAFRPLTALTRLTEQLCVDRRPPCSAVQMDTMLIAWSDTWPGMLLLPFQGCRPQQHSLQAADAGPFLAILCGDASLGSVCAQGLDGR